jgi:hypothetical protein
MQYLYSCLTEYRLKQNKTQTNYKQQQQPHCLHQQKQSLNMRTSFVFLLSLLVLASSFLVPNTKAASLRNLATEDEDLNFLEHRSGRLGLPDDCPSTAIPGNCKNCNGNGCSAFRCSAFTTWSCPSGYTYCGFEECLGGLCASRVWCVPF